MIRTLHGQLADVVRDVIKTDEGGFADLFRMGITPPPETVVLTTRMRAALAAYDAAAEAASTSSLRSLVVGAHEALEAGNTTRVSSSLAAILLILDYDADHGPFTPAAAVR